jgi:hypothetical protein
MNDMLLEFGGNHYMVDFDALDNFLFVDADERKTYEVETRVVYNDRGEPDMVTAKEETTKEFINEKEINGIRYELITDMLSTVFNTNIGDDGDDILGAKRTLEQAPFSYKMAFNTLIKYKIIKEIK